MKTRRFDYNFRPLRLNISFTVDGSVPARQTYDADAGEYTPDYTLTPLIIQPNISCMDKDEFLAAGSINQSLANVKWYEIVGGVSTLIDSANAGYEITTSGANAGRIKIKKNAQPKSPVTLQFYAEYVDPRTGQIHVIQRPYTVTCSNATAHAPQLVLDAADQTIYNPLTDPDKQTVHASLRLGDKECPESNRVFAWDVFRGDTNTWAEVGTDPAIDYDVEVAPDGASCIVNRSIMGSELYLRCRAMYAPGGIPPECKPNLFAGTKDFDGKWVNPNNAWSVSTEELPGFTVMKASDLIFGRMHQPYTVEYGKIYTFSAWVKAHYTEGRVALRVVRSNHSNTTPVDRDITNIVKDGEWHHLGVTFKATDPDDLVVHCGVEVGVIGNTIYVAGYKLEEGANDNPQWTPAPNEGIGQYLQLSDSAPAKQIAFIRRIPKFEYDITGVPTNIPAGLLAIAPEAYICDANGELSDPERELLPLWYIATNKSAGTLDYTPVAHGLKPMIPTDATDNTYGAVVGLDVIDVGPTCAMEDTDGALFEDADGNIILIK